MATPFDENNPRPAQLDTPPTVIVGNEYLQAAIDTGDIAKAAYNEQKDIDVRALTLRETFASKESANGHRDDENEGTQATGPLDGGGGEDRPGNSEPPVQDLGGDSRVTRLPTARAGSLT